MLKTLYARFLLWLIRPALIQWADNGGVDKPARAVVMNELRPSGAISKLLQRPALVAPPNRRSR